MANDLVTRLLLNSQNFDNNIRKSTQQMQTMQRQAATVKAGMASAFMGIGAAVGAAMVEFAKNSEACEVDPL